MPLRAEPFSQPYCDGSHRGTDFRPVRYVAAEKAEEVLFCGCKHTKTPPFCDGSHNSLIADYPEDDPGSAANRTIPEVACAESPRAILNGGCYVFSTARARKTERGALRYCTVIGPEFGSIHQSQFYLEAGAGDPPVVAFGERDVVLFVTEGEAEVTISGRTFTAPTHSGVFVAPGEAFRVAGKGGSGRTVKLLASACPRAGAPEWLDRMPDNFDAANPERVVPLDPSQRQGMANRYFQMLVDRSVGSKVVTQFIGHRGTALEGRTPPPSLRRGADHPRRRGLHVDREPQGPGQVGRRHLPAAKAAPFPRSDQPRGHAARRHHLSRRQPRDQLLNLGGTIAESPRCHAADARSDTRPDTAAPPGARGGIRRRPDRFQGTSRGA